MSAQYTADALEELSGIEAVRLRPNRYTFTDGEIGCHHILAEILDNAADEAMAGHARNVRVIMHADNDVEIVDDGRGIPVDINRKSGLPGVDLIFTRLNAGGKFDHKNYRVSGGLHGEGSAVANALSSRMVVTVWRDGYEWRREYRQGQPVGKLEQVRKVGKRRTGTSVRFSPDPDIYEAPRFRTERVREMAKHKAILIPGLETEFVCDGNAERFSYPTGLADYLPELASSQDCDEGERLFASHCQVGGAENRIEWALQATLQPISLGQSFANAIPTPRGGTHVKGFENGLLAAVREYAEMRSLLPRGIRIMAQDIMDGLVWCLSIYMEDIAFEGQTKQKLASREATRFVEGVVRDHMLMDMNKRAHDADQWIAAIVNRARERQKKNAAIQTAERKVIGKRTILPGKLADCQSRNVEETELFLVEGDSAGGSAKQARDRRFQAVLPIRGKLRNVVKSPGGNGGGKKKAPSRMDVISDIVHAIGCGVEGKGKGCNPGDARYGKIIIMPDADVDGAHIATLLVTFFWKAMRPLVDAGRIYIAQSPLYKIEFRKGQYAYALDDAELEGLKAQAEAENERYTITRFKGLGELDPAQLYESTMDPDTRRLVPVRPRSPDEFDDILERLMGGDARMRRTFIAEYGGDT